MGAIYLGKRIGVGGFAKDVVMKQLLPELTSDAEITELFLREARLSASLDHQNIVHTIDLLQVAGNFYIVMEYVRGGDLRTLLRRARRRSRRFSPAAALLIGRDLLDALDYAHGKTQADGSPLQLIHRDISPSNVLISTAGEVKLTDFGIAKAATHSSSRYQVRGKLGYMSPEQARGEELDARSDLFSLAVVLWEILSGRRLFVGEVAGGAAMSYNTPIPPLGKSCPGIPAEFDRVMARALSLNREDRFQTALEFQQALCGLAQRHDMVIGHAELARHLRHICGPQPGEWLRDEERTGTAAIPADEIAEDDSLDDVEVPQEETRAGRPSRPSFPMGPAISLRTARVEMPRQRPGTGPGARALGQPEGPDTTQPMMRQSLADVGIADMARKMIGPDPTSQHAGPAEVQGGGRGDDTRSLNEERAGLTRPMVAPVEWGAAAPEVPILRPRLSLLTIGVILVFALVLLGLGMLLGQLISGHPGREPGMDVEAEFSGRGHCAILPASLRRSRPG
jgi:serine/threonine-protein kinase